MISRRILSILISVTLVKLVNGVCIKVGFVQATYSLAETVGTKIIGMTRTDDNIDAFTLTVVAADGTAVSGSDYTFSQASVAFAQAEFNKQIPVTILDDDVQESSEYFYLKITSSTEPSNTCYTNINTTITITDNDQVSVGFKEATSRTVNEGKAGDVIVTIEKPSGQAKAAAVQVSAYSGTATAGVDFSFTNTSFILAPNVTSANVTVTILDEHIPEKNEYFFLKLTSNVTLTNNSSINFTIVNDDLPVSVGFRGSSTRAYNESVGMVNVTIEKTGGIVLPVTVDVAAISGTAIAGVDFTFTNTTVSLPSNVITHNLTVHIIHEYFVENDEYFYLTLKTNDSSVIMLTTSINFTILNDDDAVTVGFNGLSVRTYNESVGTVNVTIEKKTGIGLPVTVGVAAISGTAISGVDFSTFQTSVTLASNVRTHVITLTINDDSLLENDETFFLVMNNSDSSVTLLTSNITFHVLNDDLQVDVGIQGSALRSVSENVGSVNITVEKTTGLSTPVTANIQAYNKTAFHGLDYLFWNTTVSLPDGVRNKTVTVQIVDDTVVENDECFFVVLDSSDVIVNLQLHNITLCILNDDNATIGFTQTAIAVAENAGLVNLSLRLTNGSLGIPITISFVITNVSATITADHNLVTSSVTFEPGETSKNAVISIKNDKTLENSEVFAVTTSTTRSDVITLNPNSVQVTIADHGEQVTFGFVNTSFVVTEGVRSVKLYVRKSGNTSIPLDLGIETVPMNASSPQDYTHKTISDTFSVSETLKNYTFFITDDNVTEHIECFGVRLNVSRVNVFVDPQNATVCIIDDDKVTIGFVHTNMTTAEELGGVSVPIEKIGLTDIPISVRLTNGNEFIWTATEKDDVMVFAGDIVTFAPAQKKVLANITIANDNDAESAEIFSIGFTVVDSEKALVETNRHTCLVRITDKYDNEEALLARQEKEKEQKRRSSFLLTLMYCATGILAALLVTTIIVFVCIFKVL